MRLSHRYATGVKLIHIEITSVRLSHRYAMGVKLIHIKITSVRLNTHLRETGLGFRFRISVRARVTSWDKWVGH